MKELDDFSPELMSRPRLVVVNKSDVDNASEVALRLDAMLMSAATGEGIPGVLHRMADLVELAEREAPEREGFVLHRPAGEGFSFRRDAGAWIVEGAAAVRAVRFSDLTNPQAAELAGRRLQRLGVDQALAEAGAGSGDLVRIGELEFECVPPEFDDHDDFDDEEE